jgi:hypothetical protein
LCATGKKLPQGGHCKQKFHRKSNRKRSVDAPMRSKQLTQDLPGILAGVWAIGRTHIVLVEIEDMLAKPPFYMYLLLYPMILFLGVYPEEIIRKVNQGV